MPQEERPRTQTTFMKRFRRMVSNLIVKLKQSVKTWRLSNTEASSKYSKTKFKAGDEVKVASSSWSPIYAGMEGIVLEVANHIAIGWVCQVSIDIEGFEHIQYFGEDDLDYTPQRKRDDRLKELGI